MHRPVKSMWDYSQPKHQTFGSDPRLATAITLSSWKQPKIVANGLQDHSTDTLQYAARNLVVDTSER